MKTGKIEVVRHEGELLFKTPDGILLDILEAHDLYSADIQIVRNGVEFEKGDVHGVRTHEEVSIFGGMSNILTVVREIAPDCYRDCSRLLPEYFEVGDEIHFALSHPSNWGVDFRKKYAVQKVQEKLKDMSDRVYAIKDDQEFIREHEKYARLRDQEISSFIFPDNPILRRKPKEVVK